MQEILNKLLLQWSGSKKFVKVDIKEVCDEVPTAAISVFSPWVDKRGRIAKRDVHVLKRRNENVAQADDLLNIYDEMTGSAGKVLSNSCHFHAVGVSGASVHDMSAWKYLGY